MRRMIRRLRTQEKASFTVEAALILPVFLLFMLLLIYLVKLAYITIALQVTAANTVKQVAAHVYPVSMAMESATNASTRTAGAASSSHEHSGLDSSSGAAKGGLSYAGITEMFHELIPSPYREWIQNTALYHQIEDAAHQAVGDALVLPLIKLYTQDSLLNFERIHVTRIIWPNLQKKDQVMAGLELSYTMPMKVPFLYKEIIVQAKAVERVWIGDTSNATDGGNKQEISAAGPQIISMHPNPLKPGTRARLRAKVNPKEQAHVTVYYKSGQSVAKFLGEKTADDDGYVEWEWHVSGNTTRESQIRIVVEASEGKKAEVITTAT